MIFLFSIVSFSGCLGGTNVIYTKKDINYSITDANVDWDGGFANSIYLPVQIVDGGHA
jgi:hypothetical protein